jgi:hypothetical protein
MDRDELHELITTLKEEFEAGRIKVNSADTIKDMMADLDPPIVVIAPDYLAERHYRETLVVAAGADMLAHCSKRRDRAIEREGLIGIGTSFPVARLQKPPW